MGSKFLRLEKESIQTTGFGIILYFGALKVNVHNTKPIESFILRFGKCLIICTGNYLIMIFGLVWKPGVLWIKGVVIWIVEEVLESARINVHVALDRKGKLRGKTLDSKY